MEIELIKFLNNADCRVQKNVLIIGVVHGDEPQGEFLIKKYLEKNKNRLIKNNVFYIPRLNFSNKRKNNRGVDINRNFPTKNWELKDFSDDYFGGYEPNSEIETKFVVKLIEENNFDLIVTIHSPYKIVNYDGEAEDIAKKISNIVKYPVQKDIGYPTSGSFGTYAGIERGIKTITIEVDEEENLDKMYEKFEKLFFFIELEY